MLSGTHAVTLDAKGRVVIPVEFGRELRGAGVLLQADPGCLVLMGVPRWEAFLRRQETRVGRYWLSGAYPVEIGLTSPGRSSSRRLLLPRESRAHLGLRPGEEVLLVGQGDWALLCGRETWRRELELLQSYARENGVRLWRQTREGSHVAG